MDFNLYAYPDILSDTGELDLSSQLYQKYEFTSRSNHNPHVREQQNIVQRFMSAGTDYDSLILYHGMGTGKCVHPNSLLEMYTPGEPSTHMTTISDLWDKCYDPETSIVVEDQSDNTHHAYWLHVDPATKFQIMSLDPTSRQFERSAISKIYKQYLKAEPLRILVYQHLETHIKNTIICTIQHRLLLSNFEFTNNYKPGDILVGCNDNRYKLTSMYMYVYTGWVYDLEMAPHHNYIVNDVCTHNTCSSIHISEQLRKHGAIRKTLVLTKNNVLKNQYIEQMANEKKCNPLLYRLTDKSKEPRANKQLYNKAHYEFLTYSAFAKRINEWKNLDKDKFSKEVNSRYDRYLFVIDEAHNVRPSKKDNKVNVYEQIHKALHAIHSRRVLLMTGTPIRDTVDEVAYLLNLVLPDEHQLPTGPKFTAQFVDTKQKEPRFIQSEIDTLKSHLQGRISFYRANFDVTPDYKGEQHLGKLIHMRVVPSYMSDDQQAGYRTTLRQHKRSLFYSALQASLCVYNVDREGRPMPIRKRDRTTFTDHIKEMSSDSDNDRIESLRNYSCKFATVLECILHPKKKDENVFVYSSSVEGSGGKLFSTILKNLFKFTEFEKGDVKTMSKGRRYAMITHEMGDRQIKNILNAFNHSDNATGDYIRILIGSRLISEGLTFLNVRQVHVLTPFWNFTESDQAIARAIRLNSHQDLINKGVTKPVVNIYMHVAIPNENFTLPVDSPIDSEDDDEIDDEINNSEDDSDSDEEEAQHSSDSSYGLDESDEEEDLGEIEEPQPPTPTNTDIAESLNSIDLYAYYVAEQKDLLSKKMERVLKEISVDCHLTKTNNQLATKFDNTRLCEYMSCTLHCNGPAISESDKGRDHSTYTVLYHDEYMNSVIDKLQTHINQVHDKNPTIDELSKQLKVPISELVYVIADVILHKRAFTDSYGHIRYLNVRHDETVETVQSYIPDRYYYEKNQALFSRQDLQIYLDDFYVRRDLNILQRLEDPNASSKDRLNRVRLLTPNGFVTLLKKSVTTYLVHKKQAHLLATWMYETFKPSIFENRDRVYIMLNIFKPWMYNKADKTWTQLSATDEDDFNDLNDLVVKRYAFTAKGDPDPVSAYGIRNDSDHTFMIRAVTSDNKTMRKSKGQVCATIKIPELVTKFILPGKIDIKDMGSSAENLPKARKMFKDWDKFSEEQKQTILKTLSYKRDDLCKIIEKWFEAKGKLQTIFNI